MAVETTGFIHTNINCSDVMRSREFYGDQLGLIAGLNTAPEPQDGTAFGLGDGVHWDAWMMSPDLPPGAVPTLDLLEWKSPRPTGAPALFNGLGMARLAYGSDDVAGLHRSLKKAGYEVLSAPVPVGGNDEGILESFVAKDPDGQLIQIVPVPDGPLRPIMVNVNCTNAAASSLWYQLVLGIGVEHEAEVEDADGTIFGIDGTLSYRETVLRYEDDARAGFMIDLVEWRDPKPVGVPYESANHRGIYRMALGTPDIAAAYEELQRLEVECFSPPGWIDLGPGIPGGGCTAVFFSDPDGTCLELIETAIPDA